LGIERVHDIVHHHNAAIEIEKISGNGSQITVYFPAIPEADKG
jgi:hypothetical protein